MKLQRARIQNFKGVRDVELDFLRGSRTGPRRLLGLVGDNGSGKTTILQAIALTLSLATRRTRQAGELSWFGFLAERLGTLGPTRVELEVVFEPSEVETTSMLYECWLSSRSSTWRQEKSPVAPSRLGTVTLVFENGSLRSPQGFPAVLQFLGRYYVKVLLGTKLSSRDMFRDVGDVFWFDQHRNLGSKLPDREPDETLQRSAPEAWTSGVEQLRKELINWWGFHTSPYKDPARDYLAKLERAFAAVFPGTRFAGVEPRDVSTSLRAPEFYFLFERNGVKFDLAELSLGEQAVFPLLSELVRLDIARSVVLVDELELHLHPPQQQTLLAALRDIAPDCQILLTTHSPSLTGALTDEETVRLDGGRRRL